MERRYSKEFLETQEKKKWNAEGKTKPIRVPALLADDVITLAKKLDNGEVTIEDGEITHPVTRDSSDDLEQVRELIKRWREYGQQEMKSGKPRHTQPRWAMANRLLDELEQILE